MAASVAGNERGEAPAPKGTARFHVVNLGCKVNRAESDTIAASCLAAGFEEAPSELADVVIVNTCTVTAEADAKTRKAVRRAARASAGSGGTVIVTGCAAALDAEALGALAGNVVVEPVHLEATKVALALLGERAGRGGGAEAARGSAGAALESTSPVAVKLRAGDAFKTRMDIKIQDGCDNRCTYCIVYKARGPARSVPVGEVLAEVEAAARAGVNEIILTGINVGSYRDEGAAEGAECNGVSRFGSARGVEGAGGLRGVEAGCGVGPERAAESAIEPDGAVLLPQLVERIVACLEGLGSPCRVRLSSIEPQHVMQELVDVLAAHPGRVCAHFHIPLQSGCDRTLAAMGRLYDTRDFARRVEMIRAARPDAAITTDIIAGFPQESDEDFAESLEFCREMGFSRMHVFRYSRRPGTPAATMEGQVSAEVSSARAAELRALSDEMAAADRRSRVGRGERVLVIEPGRGMSESYHEVLLPVEAARTGELVAVRITGVEGELLRAERA